MTDKRQEGVKMILNLLVCVMTFLDLGKQVWEEIINTVLDLLNLKGLTNTQVEMSNMQADIPFVTQKTDLD